jgi:acylphosphatase
MITRAHLFIFGDVTGVGYRSWTVRKATKLDLTGWVRNVTKGEVEAVIEGEKNRIEEMIEMFRKGPDVAWVQKIDVEWGNLSASGGREFERFQIR